MNSSPKALYALIIIFCIFAIIAGIYAQSIENQSSDNNDIRPPTINNEKEEPNIDQEKTAEEIKEDFNNLFTNVLNLNGYNTTGISRMDPSKEIIYTAFDIQEETDTYEINIKVPAFNISNEVASSFNSITQATFLNKVNDIRESTEVDIEKRTVYSIEYAGFVNGNILSVVIKSTLKEGDSAQRIMVQTYNYNLASNQKATLTEVITAKQLNKADVSKKIMKVVEEAHKEAEVLQSMGYNEIFSRDTESSIYLIENTGTYFLGPNNELYIIYPYGNQNFTSEMDIVLFE